MINTWLEKFIHRKQDASELENYCIIVNELYARLLTMRSILQDPSFVKRETSINDIGRLGDRIITLIDVYKTNKFAIPSTMLKMNEIQKHLTIDINQLIRVVSEVILNLKNDVPIDQDSGVFSELTEKALTTLESVMTATWYLEYDVVMINTKTDIIDRYYKRKHCKTRSSGVITVKYIMPNREYINSIKGGNNDAERE